MKVMRNGKVFTQGGYTNSEKATMLKSGEERMKAFLAEKFPAIYGEPVEEPRAAKATANKSKVCVIANRLAAQGMNRSEAFRRAWQTVKAPAIETKVAGVTVGRRQEALEHLTYYAADRINIDLERETANEYDSNAVAVVVTVIDKGSYTVGYLPRILAATVAPLIDAGKAVRATFKEIRGKYHNDHNYGMAVSVNI